MIVWLASYPRSGNTFLRLVLDSLFGLPTYTLYDERRLASPDLGPAPPLPRDLADPQPRIPFDVARFVDRPELHVVKTHGLPLDGRPAIYVVRDGREATTSYFHYHRDSLGMPAPLTDVLHGRVGFGSWGRHLAVWDPCHRPNTLLLRFESLTANPIAQVERIAAFLGVSPVGNRVPTFDELRCRAPRFFRSGRTDSWKSLFTEADHAAFWDLHGDEMRAFGYGGSPYSSRWRVSRLWRRRHRVASRFSEAARPYAAAGRRFFVDRFVHPEATPVERPTA
ncbi:MAG: sulfotransferase domain-containing protein, partial [Planctomycetaceae bacterium]